MSLAVLSACSPAPPSPPPPPPPPPPPAPAPEPPPPVEEPGNWQEMTLTEGDWEYRRDGRGSLALYGSGGAEAHFLVRCELPARRIVLSRRGQSPSGQAQLSFEATHGRRSYAAQNGGDGRYVVAVTPASDGYLDALAYSRGRIAISATGVRTIAIPNWPEMIRVVEDCRS